MPATSPDSIYYADTSTADSIEDITAAQATSIQSALDTRSQHSYKWADAAARAVQTGMTEGDTGYQNDTNQRYGYDGTSWVNITSGIVPVAPTSVSGTGTTLSADGVIIMTAATAINADGCFSSLYRAYIIEMDAATTGSASITLNLRAAGTNATTAYDRTRLSGVGTTASAAQSLNASSWEMVAAILTGRHVATIKLYGPAATAPTAGTIITGSTDNPMTVAAGVNNAVIQHRTASIYDGFSITPSTGSLTGIIRILGVV